MTGNATAGIKVLETARPKQVGRYHWGRRIPRRQRCLRTDARGSRRLGPAACPVRASAVDMSDRGPRRCREPAGASHAPNGVLWHLLSTIALDLFCRRRLALQD
jgi:hypothetical protein